jgi:hypothetical protein
MKKYNNLSDIEKQNIINSEYIKNKKSFIDIAKEYNTYANKVRRDAKRFNIKARSKEEAQKNALETGKHKHPTKGLKRSQQTKEKIGMSVLKNWQKIDDKTRNKRKKEAKERWENLSEDKRKNITNLANRAVRETSKTGSKLEKFIHQFLLSKNFRVDFHKEQMLLNTKLQLDLFLPSNNIAIEVDGPSHFEPVWGEIALKRNKKYDEKKNGIIIGKGLKLIRVKQKNDFSKARAKLVCENLLKLIDQILLDKSNTKNYFEIGD